MKPNELRNKINERNWELLLDAINEGKVVPIIGEDLISVSTEEGERPIREYVLNKLSEQFCEGNEVLDFSTIEIIIKNKYGDENDIYYEIYKLLKKVSISLPDSFVSFFRICRFPLILTTSYVQGLDHILDIPSTNVKVYNKTSSDDISPNIPSKSSSLYHLFGKISIATKSFLVTDDDLLEYLHCWHDTETRPTALTKYLSDKFFLILGCNYPNWLFRFFWHSIKNFTIAPKSGMQGVVALEQDNTQDKELIGFLSRIRTIAGENPEEFVEEIIERRQNQLQLDASILDEDIFISYASEDFSIAEQIYEQLEKIGGKGTAWFDKKKLRVGEDFDEIIKKRIKQCKRFMPLISKHVLTAEDRYVKKEWDFACKVYEVDWNSAGEYISPIIIDDTNPYNDNKENQLIPNEFKQKHAININSSDFEKELKELIRKCRI
jgi:hypothetical protein